MKRFFYLYLFFFAFNIYANLDSLFNSGIGYVTTINSLNDQINKIAIQDDGKIIAVGYSYINKNSQIALVRYNTDGLLDNSFGIKGIVITPINICQANGVAIQSDNKIVVCGYTYDGSSTQFIILRYEVDGTLDKSFFGVGYVTMLIGEGCSANAVSIHVDGKIVVGGNAVVDGAPSFFLSRYNMDGTLDTNFGINGVVITLIQNSCILNCWRNVCRSICISALQ